MLGVHLFTPIIEGVRIHAGLDAATTFVATGGAWDEQEHVDLYVYWLDQEGHLHYWWWGPRPADPQPRHLKHLPLPHCIQLAMARRHLLLSNEQVQAVDTWKLPGIRALG